MDSFGVILVYCIIRGMCIGYLVGPLITLVVLIVRVLFFDCDPVDELERLLFGIAIIQRRIAHLQYWWRVFCVSDGFHDGEWVGSWLLVPGYLINHVVNIGIQISPNFHFHLNLPALHTGDPFDNHSTGTVRHYHILTSCQILDIRQHGLSLWWERTPETTR